MSDHEYHFNVSMACESCSNAVNRVLNRLDGVKDVQISLPEQSVKVKAGDNVTYDKVLETIKKTGKTVNDGKTVA